VYQIIHANGGWNNWEVVEIEKYPCSDENEAHAQEPHWQEILNAALNIHVPNRSGCEYRNI
jgi:hypothetical protein